MKEKNGLHPYKKIHSFTGSGSFKLISRSVVGFVVLRLAERKFQVLLSLQTL